LLPVMSSNSVVLPEPFGPRTPTIAGRVDAKSASSENVTSRRTAARVALVTAFDVQQRAPHRR
jgi:hypothetical protein